MTFGFKILASHLLVIFERNIQIKIITELIVDFLHLIEKFLCFGCGVTQTPGAGEVVVISAACLGGINIKHDGLTKFHQVGWVASGMWHACIAPNREDETRRQFRAALCHPETNLRVHVANRQRGTVFVQQNFIAAHSA